MKRSLFIICLGAFLAACSCSTEPHGGVVLGNPNLDGKALRIVPETGNEVYLITFQETTAEVSLIQIEGSPTLRLVPRLIVGLLSKRVSTVLETAEVPYTVTSGTLSVTASFSSGRAIGVTATVTDEGEIEGAALQVDEASVAATFDVQPSPENCLTGAENAGIVLSEESCSRVVNCHAQITCSECQTNLLPTPVRTSTTFEGPPTEVSLQDLADLLDAGTAFIVEPFYIQCRQEMQNTSCDGLAAYFDPADRTDYSGFQNIFDNPASACFQAIGP